MKISNALKQVIRQSWDANTCYPVQRDEWKNEIPELGQCAVTALLLQDYLGGRIAFNKANDHLWNILPNGQVLDLTNKQFSVPVNMEVDAFLSREDVLYSKEAEKQNTLYRYKLLKRRVQNKLKKMELVSSS